VEKWRDREIRGTGSVGIRICSTELINNIQKYNLVPNKTFIASAPDCLKYNKDFWRGCIDGDGTISKSNSKGSTVYRVGLYGTETLCQQFIDFVEAVLPTEKVNMRIYAHTSIYKVFLNNRQQCKRLLELLYLDANIYLERKYISALNFIEEIPLYITYKIDVYNKNNIYLETINSFEECAKKFQLTKKSVVSAISKKQLCKGQYYFKTNKCYDKTSLIDRTKL